MFFALSHTELASKLWKICCIVMAQFFDTYVFPYQQCKGTKFSRHMQIFMQLFLEKSYPSTHLPTYDRNKIKKV